MRKVELLPTWDCEAGYGPGQYTKHLYHLSYKEHTSYKKITNKTKSNMYLNNLIILLKRERNNASE